MSPETWLLSTENVNAVEYPALIPYRICDDARCRLQVNEE